MKKRYLFQNRSNNNYRLGVSTVRNVLSINKSINLSVQKCKKVPLTKQLISSSFAPYRLNNLFNLLVCSLIWVLNGRSGSNPAVCAGSTALLPAHLEPWGGACSKWPSCPRQSFTNLVAADKMENSNGLNKVEAFF